MTSPAAAKTIEPLKGNCPTCGARMQTKEKQHHVVEWCAAPGLHYLAHLRRADSETMWGPVSIEAQTLFEVPA